MFVGTLILLITTEKFIKKPKPQQPCISCNPKTTQDFCPNCGKIGKQPKTKLNKADLAKIASIAIVIALLLSIQAPVFALTEGPAQILVQTPSGLQPNTQTLPLPQIAGYNLSYVYRDSNFEKLSGEDASLVYAYAPNEPNKPTIWVAVELASTTGPLHRWETCLVNYPLSQGLQPQVTQLDLTDIQTQANPPIVGRYFAFQYHSTNQTQVVLYWFTTATFNVDNQTQQKQVKLSIVAYPKSPEDVKHYEELMLPIAQSINDYWEPIKTWTTIALTISQNGLTLSAISIALLAVLVCYRVFLNFQDKASLLTLYGKLPTQKQQLIQAVANAKKQGNPTTNGVAEELAKLTNSEVNQEHLSNELEEAEKIGLIEKTLINKEDKPAYAWKSLLPQSNFFKSAPIISKLLR